MIVTYMNWVVKWWLYVDVSFSVLPLSWVIKTEPPACAKYTSWLTLNNSDCFVHKLTEQTLKLPLNLKRKMFDLYSLMWNKWNNLTNSNTTNSIKLTFAFPALIKL